jgi:hypothetical protein
MLTQSPHDIVLPTFAKPADAVTGTAAASPRDIAQSWLDKFNSLLTQKDPAGLASIVHDDSWWRDFLALTWDYRTIRGSSNLISFLTSNITKGLSNLQLYTTGQFAPHFETPIENLEWVVSMFNFDTKVGNGKGMIRLARGDDGDWKAHMISTSLQELVAYPEAAGARRPLGGKNSLDGGMITGNWLERRETQKEFLDEDPTVFVIGAGMFVRLQLRCKGIDLYLHLRTSWPQHGGSPSDSWYLMPHRRPKCAGRRQLEESVPHSCHP